MIKTGRVRSENRGRNSKPVPMILLLFFLLFSLSATSQTKDTVFLDHYEILEPNLYQYIKENVIEKLSDQDKCTITSGESKKGTWVCITAYEQGGSGYERIPKGYLLISDHLFLLYDPENIPGLSNVRFPTRKYEHIKTKKLPEFDGGKEWWFLYTNNKYYLINEVTSW